MKHKYAALKMVQIRRNEGQPREKFDKTALQELADSIKQYGLLQPVVVRKLQGEAGYELVAGERRYRANEMAGNITIEAKVLLPQGEEEITDLDSFKRAMTENITRADMTPLEEARGYKKVLDLEDGATVQSVAKDFKKSTPYVTQRLALLDLRPELAQAVDDGHIGTAAAVQAAALSRDSQKNLFDKWKKGDFNGSDNQLIHVAYAMRKQEKAQQESMVEVEEVSAEEKAAQSTARAKTRTDLDRIEQICGLLADIGKMKAEDLARHLEGEVGARLEQIDRVAEAVQKARWNLRQAKAHADAAELVVSPTAQAPDLAEAARAHEANVSGSAQDEEGGEQSPESTEPEAAPGQPQADAAPDAEQEGEGAEEVDAQDREPALASA
ncbi:ParB/RepB/Spo0J family partition protein [Streptomyces spiramyceticus]|uniref:ParB/RepB/Spo0J family partition protein n=1 Tax=Streptomyces spiramyceticus TaxID=299717 RepID=UPI00237AC5DC|nr:ParB/RepB/Spo0J family partition protein [Streptomyces spiramyceticus]